MQSQEKSAFVVLFLGEGVLRKMRKRRQKGQKLACLHNTAHDSLWSLMLDCIDSLMYCISKLAEYWGLLGYSESMVYYFSKSK
uniref:Uncharacterized protein n=1 Tax=Rhizophora mucronata TaxID=61149 RepID=A0A2P2P3J2_RHIMU